MSEPTNPLFEQEKAFLERKKLEYERALRGDVAQIKEQTAHVGRIAMVGAGLAGSVWLITKAFGGRKRRKQADWHEDDDESRDYGSQHFADYDFDDEEGEADQATDSWQDPYFGSSDEEAAQDTSYHSDTDYYDSYAAPSDDSDDNGLHDYPDFPAHSSRQHGEGSTDPNQQAEQFESEAYGHPESTLPFDDSRRLPESEEFSDENDVIDQHPDQTQPTAPKRTLGASLVAFAKSDLGKILVGQAASVAIALVTKALKEKQPSNEPETTKYSDLADLTGKNDGYAHGHPATPQSDVYSAPADAPTYREPLA